MAQTLDLSKASLVEIRRFIRFVYKVVAHDPEDNLYIIKGDTIYSNCGLNDQGCIGCKFVKDQGDQGDQGPSEYYGNPPQLLSSTSAIDHVYQGIVDKEMLNKAIPIGYCQTCDPDSGRYVQVDHSYYSDETVMYWYDISKQIILYGDENEEEEEQEDEEEREVPLYFGSFGTLSTFDYKSNFEVIFPKKLLIRNKYGLYQRSHTVVNFDVYKQVYVPKKTNIQQLITAFYLCKAIKFTHWYEQFNGNEVSDGTSQDCIHIDLIFDHGS